MFNPSPQRRRPASARRQLLAFVTAALIVLQPVMFDAPRVAAQVTPTLGTPYTQNFDTLPASGSATWTNNSTIPGWFHARTGTGTTIVANNGSSNAGNLYSYGCTDANAPCNVSPNATTDRALGSLGSGNAAVGNLYWGLRLQNNTGSTITSLAISYTGEQWRNSAAAAQTVSFSYLVGSPTVTGSLAEFQSAGVAVPQLDFTSPITGGTAGALNGNLAANRVALSHTITSLNIPNGTEVMLRWSDPDHTGADHGLAIDDFSVTANGAGGGQPTLAINDVSQDEGNSGQTAFTFTVSLSSSTHGGVTFDIATADGTAQDDNPNTEDNDYVANSSTGVTIPNGQQSAQFTVQVNGDTTSEPNETFFVNVTSVTGATVTDGQGQGTIVNDDITLLLISEVQGSTPSGNANSPRVGQTVSVRGIVTLLKSNGFFLQEEVGDNDSDPNTSEGIFVFTSSAPLVSVGDQATVTGSVVEFNGLTEISTSNASVSVNSTGNTLPTAVTLTPADLPPTANFAQPQLEKYEGMRLFAQSLTTVAPNDNFFDVFTVLTGQPRPMREPGIPASDPIPPDPTSGTPDPNIPIWDENPERLILDTNGRAGSAGETITSNVVITNVAGPLDFAFGAYRLINEANLTRSGNMSAIPAPTPVASEFTVASYNIENFNNNATQRAKAAQTICNVLHRPDIVGAVEIFDLADLQALAAEVQTLCGVTYSAHLIEQDGTSEDSDQDVAFLVKTSRVSVTSVTAERTGDTFINPNNGQSETTHDRPPLLLRGTVDPNGANPQPVLVIVNHLRSFIDIELVSGEGVRVRAKRKAQAESLAGLFQELQTNNPGVPVISVGDYNAFQFNNGYDDPISVLKGTPTPDDQIVVDQSPDLVNPDFYNLIEDLPASERYSFIFEGTPQALDHHLVNTVARARNTRTAIARVNADFPEAAVSVFASNASRPERNSDHDPVVSYYALGAPQPVGSVLISEFRFRGPAVAATPDPGESDDEFVEVYNNTNSAVTVSTTDGSSGWAIVGSDGTTLVTIPNGTVIPARGHWLGVNAVEYSLADYGGTGAAQGDDGWIGSSIPDNGGVALFRTANPANYTLNERLDAVGYTTAPALYREGAGLPTGGPEFNANVSNFSFYRDLNTSGNVPKDTGDNAADFIGVSVDGQGTGLGQRLGAPGPENLSSPRYRNMTTQMTANYVDPCASSTVAPNRVRVTGSYTDTLSGTGTYPLGYLDIRRKFTNNTGAPVTRLRFRVHDLTTFPSPSGTADLRSISAPGTSVSISPACGGAIVPVGGTTLEQPPAQPMGGGLNSSVSAGDITLGSPLAPGATTNLNFRFAVAQGGSFRAFIIVEALP